MNTLLLMILTVLTACKVKAQDNDQKRLYPMFHFHSLNTIQVLNGSTTTSLAVNTVNGVQFGKLFAGIGTGFDYYYHISVPLFMEAKVDLLSIKGKLQLFGNSGLNFPFAAQNNKLEYKNGNYKTGHLFGAGIDYLIPVKKDAVIAGIAFSNKTIIQMTDNNIWNPILNRIENIPIRDKYSLNRIALRVGWMF